MATYWTGHKSLIPEMYHCQRGRFMNFTNHQIIVPLTCFHHLYNVIFMYAHKKKYVSSYHIFQKEGCKIGPNTKFGRVVQSQKW